jgi:plastocyanin
MRRLGGIVAMLVLSAVACFGGSGTTRLVRVDFRQDEFASFYWRFFPRTVEAHPGDTLVFDQQWTGEPHTVTMGRLVDKGLPAEEALEAKFSAPMTIGEKRYANFEAYLATLDPEESKRAIEKAEAEQSRALGGVPVFDPFTGLTAQNAEQPCYLDDGTPPADKKQPCAKRKQPTFTGRQAYYSSGFIPPSGASGNTFRVKLAHDIAPGTYRYFCIIHFPFMQGQIDVKPKSAKVATQAEINVRARQEIETLAGPLRKAYDEAKAGRAHYGRDRRIPLPMGGYHSSDEYTVALLEFVPKMITTRVGRPMTWTLVGAHTVSFGVPRYLPIYFVEKDGTVRRNTVVDKAAGGSPPAPPVDFNHPTYDVDGGTYSGSGFYSSGLLGSEPFSKYTLRFAKPGTYRFACLVHPDMVGKVDVTA